ncbi:hypothetical protein [Allonocardiopsis opalescens]|uniref:Histone acetyltransferase Rv0428c-like SH3 domain-containing protein n=1 Tax=Allonocardiopsis opalescens TaxID=1144618 RepID=A0A2T0QDF9_9ACTN|nr:hypothetical protein [Allonocardiopsis opalescens]PRY01959.1 hypothetical protein CLV72_101557 [Allonocardiopsis opalescens]
MEPPPAARPSVSVSAADTGRRVSVRRRLPSGWLGDVVGVLEFWRDGVLGIRRRDGSVTEVTEASLVAGRVVPEAAPGTRATRRRA